MSIFAAPSFYSKRDQDIYNEGFFFQPRDIFSDGIYKPPAATTTNMGGAAAATGINTVLNQGGGGGGGIPFSGTATDLTTAFQKAVDDRQNRLTELNYPYRDGNVFFPGQAGADIKMEGIEFPAISGVEGYPNKIINETIKGAPGVFDIQPASLSRKIQEGLYSLPFLNKPQSADQIIQEGYEPQIKLGILQNILPDRFGTLSRGDQAFIQRNMGYTGPTVFGENTTGGAKDPFGLNVRSGFGNYAERVGVEAEKLGESLSGRLADKYGVEFDEETGMFVGPNAAKANQMTRMMRAKFNFYKEQTKQRDADRAAAAAAQAAAERKAAAEGRSDPGDRSREGASGRRPGSGGTVDRRDSGPDRNVDDTGQAYDSGGREGFGYGLADGGRVYYMDGGLADLVDIYD